MASSKGDTMTMRFFFWLALAFLAGCATPAPKESPPVADQAVTERILNRYPTDEEKFAIHAVPDSFFGASTSSRGSVAAGILLGPLGVAGNVAHVRSESERQAVPLKPLLAEDLRRVLAAQAPNAALESAPLPPRLYALVPSAAVEFQSDEEFRLRCSLNVSLMEGTNVLWRSRYLVPVEGAFTHAAPQDVDKAKAELGPCFGRAYALFQQHKTNRLGSFKEYEVVAEYTFHLQLLEWALPDRIIASDPLGLFERRRSDVKSIKPR